MKHAKDTLLKQLKNRYEAYEAAISEYEEEKEALEGSLKSYKDEANSNAIEVKELLEGLIQLGVKLDVIQKKIPDLNGHDIASFLDGRKI